MTLELLANELLLILFEFLTSAHILRAFRSLNSRFDALLLIHFQGHNLHYPSTISFTNGRWYTSLAPFDINDPPGQIDQFFAHGLTIRQSIHLKMLSLSNFPITGIMSMTSCSISSLVDC